MGHLVLYIFSGNRLEEFRLTNLKDGKEEIRLYPSDYSKFSDYIIYAQFKNGCWSIIGENHVRFSTKGQWVREKELVPGEVINVDLPQRGEKTVILVEEDNPNNGIFTKYNCSDMRQITIGRSSSNLIQYNNTLISSEHGIIKFENDKSAQIVDLNSQNGIYLNGNKVNSSKLLKFGDVIFIMGLKIVYLKTVLAVNNPNNLVVCNLIKYNEPDEKEAKYSYIKAEDGFFQRSPRIIKKPQEGTMDIDSPPQPQPQRNQPLILTLGPSLTMGIAMLASLAFSIYSSKNNTQMVIPSAIMCVSMLTGTVVWPIFMRNYMKKTAIKDEERRVARYKQYLGKVDNSLTEAMNKNTQILYDTYPDIEICVNRVINRDRRLWERTINNDDFLDVRLGRGVRPSFIGINTPKERFTMVDDPLMEEINKIQKKFSFIHNVPITLSLRENNMLGIIGERRQTLNMAMNIAVQLSALHSYDEVKLMFIYNRQEERYWQWVKWLPHAWNPDRSLRFIGTNHDQVHEILLYLEELLRDREGEIKENYIIFIADPSLVENEPIMHYLINNGEKLGVTIVLIYDKMNMLPNECNAIVQCVETNCSLYHRDDPNGKMLKFDPDTTESVDLNGFARSMIKIKIKEIVSAASIPSTLTFFELYGVGNVDQLNISSRWNESISYKSLAAPLGVKAGDEVFSLNIHEKYHGPHGLVAGMTGSGKSEFIQSYILSMAINYHPHDVSFILIDYKGGGMANCFTGLPHISGTITNLGGNQIRRSLISLKSELKRRQRIFAEFGVNHIDKYQQMYKEHKVKEPIPHLVIISDEFAELKSQQPEFMQELVSAARIGRSLGVHLILATQKPSGVVDDQIWSNTRFRACLKVLDKMDSNEMLKRPEAANIVQPGRCYIQVGNNEIFELIQSGWSGAPYVPREKVENEGSKLVKLIDLCGRALETAVQRTEGEKTSHTQLSAVVESISQMAKEQNLKPLKLWLKPLKEVVYLDEIDSTVGEWMCPTIGIVDDPENQAQYPLRVNMGEEGHVVLFGAPGTGKTTFLQTLIYSLVKNYSPEQVNIYIADFGGRTMGYFKELPHVGGIVFSDQDEKLSKLFKMFIKELENRKKLFSEYGVGNLKSYMDATNKTVPAMIFVLDNYSAFCELYPDYDQDVVLLCREGGNYGLYMVMTGSNQNAIKYRITQNIKLMYALELNDRYDYVGIVGQTGGLEPEPVKGRGLVKIGVPLEFQTALAIQSDNEAERVYKLREIFKEMNKNWTGPKAKPIPFVPEELTPYVMLQNDEVKSGFKKGLIPMGYDIEEAEIVYKELKNTFILPVLGFEKTGKTNMLKSFMSMIKSGLSCRLYVVDNEDNTLESYSSKCGIDGYIWDTESFDEFMAGFIEEIKVRHKDVKAFREMESNPAKEYEYMQKYPPIFMLIDNFDNFFDMISDASLELMQNICKMGNGLGLYIIVTANPSKIGRYSGQAIYSHMFSGGEGILLGGRMDSQNVLNANMSFNQRSAQLEPGYGYYIQKNNYVIIKTPLA